MWILYFSQDHTIKEINKMQEESRIKLGTRFLELSENIMDLDL